jgi:4-amino-4-deoxy-L-arabinose transferase-like glycosyltransferase
MRRLLHVLPSTPAQAFWLAAGIACGVGLIVIWVGPWGGISERFGGREHDGYLELARNLLAGHGYVFEPGGPPALHRPPLYPLLLVPVVALPEPLQRPVLIVVQSGLVGGIAVMVWKIGARLFGQLAGGVAVAVMLLDPWLIWVVKNPVSIIVQTFLYTTLSWLLVRAFGPGHAAPHIGARRPGALSGPLAVLLGVNAGALALVHGTMLLTCTLILAGVGLWRLRAGDVRSAAGAMAAWALMLAIIAPWTARNWLVSGLFIPVAGNAGFTYLVGNAHWGIGQDPVRRGERPWEAALRHGEIDRPAAEVIRFYGNTDPVLEREFNRRMIAHVLDRPEQLFLKLSLNALEFYFPLAHPLYLGSLELPPAHRLRAARDWLRPAAITLFHGVLWALALAGVARSRTRQEWRVSLGVLTLIAVFSIAYLPFWAHVGHSLYALPTIPLLSVLAAVGLGVAGVRASTRVVDRLPVVR